MPKLLRDANGNVILDADGEPVYTQSSSEWELYPYPMRHPHTIDTLTVGELLAEDFNTTTTWFNEQLISKTSEPKIRFLLSGSDHGPRVTSWPTIRRSAEKLTPLNLSVSLANEDGLYNSYYSDIYTLNSSCSIQFGYTHPTSGDELVNLFVGNVKKISFPDQTKIKFNLYDKIYNLSQIKVGQTDTPASFTSQIPSDIAWTLCTSYGQFSDVTSTSNPDIDYNSFNDWAATFSQDNVVTTAYFKGEKVTEALNEIIYQTDSYLWVNGNGKLVFERFTENSSADFVLEEGKYKNISVSLDGLAIINRQYVSFNYSINSDYWQNQIYEVNSTSVNSFGLHEDVIESSKVWYTNSAHANNIASRRISRWATPPRKFLIDVPLFGLNRKPADMIRFVNSFFAVDSSAGWRITGQEINLNPKKINVRYSTNEGLIANAFYLDISYLDGTDQLL